MVKWGMPSRLKSLSVMIAGKFREETVVTKRLRMKAELLACVILGMLLTNAFGDGLPHKGKKANFIGDSITQGAKSYVATVKDVLGLSVARNYGIGGGALCYRNDIPRLEAMKFAGKRIDAAYPPVVSKWQDMDDDADIVFMLIGTNDFSSGVPLGAVDSVDTKEFNGGLNVVLKGLKKKYPGKVIVVSTILKRTNGGKPLLPYNTAIRDACKRHGIVCYDAYSKSGLDFAREFHQGAMTTSRDGLHPNAAGAKILGKRIAEFINKVK